MAYIGNKVNGGLADGNAVVSGTLDVSNAVTADGGIGVDNITIDGTEIDLSSGNLTIDVAGDIILDADGGDIFFNDAGVTFAKFSNVSTDFVIKSSAQDKDLIFKGNDNGSEITALTLDMSEAGAATFNGAITANAGVVVDNITIDGTEIDLSSGGLTIDVAGAIELDSDTGVIDFDDDTLNFGRIENSSSDFKLESRVQDKDIIFTGNDGGSGVTALQLDMSNSGFAFFNANAFFNENSIDTDFRIKSVNETNMFYVDASTDRIGIGTSSPSHRLDLVESANDFAFRITNNSDGSEGLQVRVSDNDTGEYILELQSSTSATGTNYTSRFNVTKSGNVGIGTTSPASLLTVNGDGTTVRLDGSADTTKSVFFRNTTTSNPAQIFADGSLRLRTEDASTAIIFNTNSSGTNNERMRIDGSGNVHISKTSSDVSTAGHTFSADGFVHHTRNGNIIHLNQLASSGSAIIFFQSGGEVGSVTTNSSSTAYNTSSDYRLKENVDYDWDATSRLKKLKPARFNFKIDKDTTVDGFLAHEVSSIVPEAITGEKDATEKYTDDDGVEKTREVYQGIDQSKLVPLLVKTVQEQQTVIESLTARIAKLEE